MKKPKKHAYQLRYFLALAFIGALCESTAFAGRNTLAYPVVPINPTSADCRELDHEYYLMKTEVYHRMSACMREGLKFGYGLNDSCTGYSYSAYIHCDSIQQEQCDVSRESEQAMSICRSRITENKEPQSDHREANLLKRANDTAERFISLVRLTSNPKRYLRNALINSPSSIRKVFGPNNNNFNGSLAEEIYRFAHNTAIGGVAFTPNPIILQIQKSVLNEVSIYHMRTLNTLGEYINQMNEFNTQWDNSLPTNTPKQYNESGKTF